jgi:hypothetical protein
MDKKIGRIGLTHCPACRKENYAFSVLDCTCAWCGFDLAKQEKKKET